MFYKDSLKELWNHSIQFEAAVCFHICLGIYDLDMHVPATVIMGQTADISHICQYEWFDWVMCYEPVNGYPNDKVTIERYLGPAIDVGFTMTINILKQSGGFVCRSTVRLWTKEEEANPVYQANSVESTTSVYNNLSSACTVPNFAEDDLTPEFEYYEGEDKEGCEETPDEIILPTPEMNYNYVSARVQLPHGNNIVQSRVSNYVRDSAGNSVDRADNNLIKDSRGSTIEFEDGHESKFATNIIAQSMYAQCDPNENMYVI